LERWADEEAAGRDVVGRARLREALLAVASEGVADQVAAFNGSGGLLERVAALDADPPRRSLPRSLAVYGPAAAVTTAATLSLGAWLGVAHLLLSAVGLCQL
jgi:hypothetical protein